jgi:tyrosyl-tRNA synthetase
MVHGETALAPPKKRRRRCSAGQLARLSAGDVIDIFEDVPSTTLPAARTSRVMAYP